MAEKWTNRSSPVSLVMKPKPLASLNHFTIPEVFFIGESPFCAAFGDSQTCSCSRAGKSLDDHATGEEGGEFLHPSRLGFPLGDVDRRLGQLERLADVGGGHVVQPRGLLILRGVVHQPVEQFGVAALVVVTLEVGIDEADAT